VHFTSTDGAAILPANSTLTNGVGTFSSTLNTAGSQTITATDTVTSSITGTSNTITVTSTAATHFAISAPASATPGVAFNFTITALNLSNGTATGYSGTVHFTSTDGSAILPADSTLTNGVGTFNSTLNKAGSQTIIARDTVTSSITGTSNLIVVGAQSTITTLTLSFTSVNTGTPVTLTATVQAGGSPVTTGRVKFCDAMATYCEGPAIFDAAQLTSGGTASIKLMLGIGTHSIKAVFAGTNSDVKSSSATQALTVTGTYPTTTTIVASGSTGNYTLIATVAGSNTQTPTGTVSFLDTSNGNASLGTATLGAGTVTVWGSTPVSTSPGTGANPNSEAVGDFNGDGRPDLAIANQGSNTLTILLGNGDGTFTSAVSPATGTNPDSIAVGDFNGDDKQDLAVANYSSNIVTILLGNGDGTFTAASSPATGNHPSSVAVEDFNGDDKQDLAVANYSSNTVTILLGNGDGTFTAASVSPVTGNLPQSLVVEDFNGDGTQDLAVANNGANSLTILLGNGDGTFTAASVSPGTGFAPISIAVGDFNDDGIPDLAVANGDNSITIQLGSGDGTFTLKSAPTAGNNPHSVAVGDFNGDGKQDLAVSNFDANTATILLGNGDGTFTAAASSPSTGTNPSSIAVGDFNGDGKQDLAVTNRISNDATILLDTSITTATATLSNVSVSSGGTHNVDASYPGDTNYSLSLSGTAPLAGLQTTPTITWATPVAIIYGTALSATQLNATASVPGTFVYNPPAGMVLTAGTHLLNVTFTPTDTTNYTTATASVQLTVNKATPTITWAIPVAISYGTALSSTQLDATASVSGTFSYNHTTGTVLAAGIHTLSVTFTPTDITDYTTQIASVSLTVNKAALVVASNNETKVYGAALPTLTGTITGLVNGDNITATYFTTATATSPVGTYPITATLNDPNGRLPNYSVTLNQGTLTITQYALTAIANNATKVYSTVNPAFTGTVTGAANGDTFTESFSTTATLSSLVGAYPIVPSVTGANLSQYTVMAVDGSLTVTQAATTTTLSASSASITPGQSLTLTAQVKSSTTGTPTGTVNFYDGTLLLNTASLSNGTAGYTTTTLASGVSHALTAVYAGDANFTGSNSGSATTVTVTPLGFTLSVEGPTSQTVIPGNSLTFSYNIAPTYSVYPGPVTFSVSGLPAGASSAFSASTIAANAGPQNVTLTIHTAAITAMRQSNYYAPWTLRGKASFAIVLLLLPFARIRRMRRRLDKHLLIVLLLLTSAGAAVGLSGCGTSNGFVGQRPKNYIIAVTAISGNVQHTSTVNLNLQ